MNTESVAPILSPARMTDEEFHTWTTMDDEHPVAEELSEEQQDEAVFREIIQDIKPTEVVEVNDDELEESDNENEIPTPTFGEMRNALQLLRTGLERKGYADISQFEILERNIRNFLRQQALTQLTIEQCFK